MERVTGIEPALSAWELAGHAPRPQCRAAQRPSYVVRERPLSLDPPTDMVSGFWFAISCYRPSRGMAVSPLAVLRFVRDSWSVSWTGGPWRRAG